MIEPALPLPVKTPSPTAYDLSQIVERSLIETSRTENGEAAMREVRVSFHPIPVL